MGATLFTRSGDDWNALILLGETTLPLPGIGVELPLSELYRDIDLPPADADD